MKRLLLIAFILLVVPTVASANQAARGWCESGAQVVVTSGLNSTTKVQASYPSCTIQVNVLGGGLATIFADNSGTVLPNPFTAQTNGQWTFFAANGHYSITLSGGGLASPVVYTDVLLNDAAVATAVFQPAGVGHAQGLVPDPGSTIHSPAWLLGDNATFINPSTIITGGLSDPGSNGIVKRTALNATAIATATDIIAPFMGCSGTLYLGADGACHVANPNLVIDVGSQTGAFFDTQQISSATITNTSPIVTAPSGTFKSTDCVGGSGCTGTGSSKNFVGFATCSTGNTHATDAPIIAETTIVSFQSSSQVTVGVNATGDSSPGTGCIFWGHPDDAAFTAADAAAVASSQCPTINLPGRQGWVEKPHFIVDVPICDASPGAVGGILTGYGEVIRGQGKGSSILFIAPNLKSNAASCTGNGGTACFFGQQGMNLRDFQMSGGDNIATAFSIAHQLYGFNGYTVLSNVSFLNYGGNDTNLTISLAASQAWDFTFAGVPEVMVTGQTYLFGGAFQSNCLNAGFEVQNAGFLVSTGTSYSMGSCVNGVAHTSLRNAAIYYSYGDFFFNETTQNFAQALFVNAVGTSQAYFYGSQFAGQTGMNNLIEPINNAVSGALVYLSGTSIACGSSQQIANNVGTIIDGGANTVIAGTCTSSLIGGTTTGPTFQGSIKFLGGTSGSAGIGVTAVAGTPSRLLLPTSDPSVGQVLTAAAPSGGAMQTSWGNPNATAANCSSSASPAVCGSAGAGSVVVAAAASTVVVNTTAVTANSQILLTRDDSLGTKLSVTCNTATAAGDIKTSARTATTSFTITVQNAPSVNPLCLSYEIIN